MENKQEIQKKEKPRCNKCGSGFVYFRLKDKSICCRSCGNIYKVDQGEE